MFGYTYGLYFAIFDKKFGDDHLINHSYLYAKSRVGKVFNWKTFWFCILWSTLSSFFIIFIKLNFLKEYSDCYWIELIIFDFTVMNVNNKWLLISKKSIFVYLLFIFWFWCITKWDYIWGNDELIGIIPSSDLCDIPRTTIYTLTSTFFILDIFTFSCF